MKYLLSLVVTLSLVIASQASFGMLDKVDSIDQISVNESNLPALEDQKTEKFCNRLNETSDNNIEELIMVKKKPQRKPRCCGFCQDRSGQYSNHCLVCKSKNNCYCKSCSGH